MGEAPTKRSIAVLAADAVGYSHVVATDEALALRALASSRRLIDPLIEEHGGRIFNTAGDSVLAEFPRAAEPVRCAVAIQETLRGTEGKNPLLTFRIGISFGEAIADGSNLLGATVNMAARLEAVAPAGGLCISGAVHDAIIGEIAYEWQDLGFRHLKNLIKPVRIFRLAAGNSCAVPVVAGATKPLIIVLPFASKSGGQAEEAYLSDGITEDVIAGLSRFGRLAVLGMASSDAYRDRTAALPDLVKELGVDYAVQGSVRRAGETIRLSVQLIDARSGLAIWAERYDRIIDNLFAVQDDISATIVATIAGQLEDEGAAAASRKRTENMEAYDFLLRGIHLARALDPASATAALAMFEKALALDPDYALALAWFALMKLRVTVWHPGDPDEILEPAQRALERDPSESWCHLVFGQIMMYRGQLAEAEQHHQRAYQLNPFDAHVMALRAPLATYLGRPGEGERWARRAMQLNPAHPDWYATNLGLALYCQGRYQEAVSAYAEVAAPQIGILAGLAASYAQLGDMDRAAASKKRLLELAPDFSAKRAVGSRPFLLERDRAHLREGLEKAGLPL
ncbi:adenylate/guanylate cyclase domain-containing protein [Mesorhizobium sp. BAC0120]|uniref:adenylate/guanylate cyclase domain-containing protein n=1 Tax=Mesorhizobium sp. BAC0120 TaxID=3090670 RepID=UPI00298D432B|nr:adenylate/guanylate cyclase domain-containing protein [Mesorhizobium sp. BAC0120]MDW6020260.1 adenylate/guanylate cyclase domain-containing protein [Mesorhizobium sp. BAC0120]